MTAPVDPPPSASSPLGPLRRRLFGIGGGSLTAAGLLSALALIASAAERDLRRELFAARIFDAMEQELGALVSAEERRPFYHYRPLHRVPTADGGNSLVRSPLADPPGDLWNVGWYQIGPDGALEPLREGDRGEIAAALALATPSQEPPEALQAQRGPAERVQVPELQLNRAAVQLSSRNASPQLANFAQLQAFDHTLPAESPVAANAEVAAEVGPLEGLDAGAHLVIRRTVTLSGQRWTQGFVIRRAAWQQHLSDRVVGEAGLDSLVRLDWDGSGGDGVTHTFSSPFSGMTARATVETLPGFSRDGYVVTLAALVVLITAFGLRAVWRSARVAVEYGERRADFAATVTHELKTPLTTIRLYAEMLEGEMVSPDRRAAYLARIRTEAERLSVLVDAVLTAARLQRNLPLPQGEPGALGEALSEIAESMTASLNARDVVLELHCDPLAGGARLPRAAIVQVVGNLIDNAAKFGRGPIVLSAEMAGDFVVLSVRDHGPGVPPNELGRLFEPFYRSHGAVVRQTRGAGLGLSIVQSVATQLGGTVEARNHVEGGLKVLVRLPVTAPEVR